MRRNSEKSMVETVKEGVAEVNNKKEGRSNKQDEKMEKVFGGTGELGNRNHEG